MIPSPSLPSFFFPPPLPFFLPPFPSSFIYSLVFRYKSHCLEICKEASAQMGGCSSVLGVSGQYDKEGTVAKLGCRGWVTAVAKEWGRSLCVRKSTSMQRWGQAWLWSRVRCTAKEIRGGQVHRVIAITQPELIHPSCDKEDIWVDGITDWHD